MSRFEAVVFDFGGVFTSSPVENFAAFEAAHGLPERFIGGVIKTNVHDNAFARFERGEIDLETFDGLFATETRAAGFEITGRTLVSLLSLTLKPDMIEAHRRIRAAGLKTGCITNTMPRMDGRAMAADPAAAAQVAQVFAAFDQVIESARAGVRKPEPRIYAMMLDALSLPAAVCIFIDDLGQNLKPARDMGFATVKAPFGDVRPAIRALEALTGLALLD